MVKPTYCIIYNKLERDFQISGQYLIHQRENYITGYLFRLGPNIALIYQNRSYCDSETKGNVEAQKRKQGGKPGRGQRQLKINTTLNNLCLVSSLQSVRHEWPYQEHEISSSYKKDS